MAFGKSVSAAGFQKAAAFSPVSKAETGFNFPWAELRRVRNIALVVLGETGS